MKKLLFFMGCLVVGVSYGQTVNIPDPVFKAYLVNNPQINTNGDDEIQESEAATFNGAIDCPQNAGISDVTGLQSFVNLQSFYCNRNQLTSIDLTNNTEIEEVSIYLNKIQSIDVSKNTKLAYLDLGDNLLTNVDLFYNIKLSAFYCTNNKLENLNLKSNILPEGNVNRNLNTMIVDNNPNLFCIQVDDVALANSKTYYGSWRKDAGATYNTICKPVIYIPDVNFKAYLVGNSAINTDGDDEVSPEEALAFNGNIECSGKNIANLRGVEAFVNIKQLDVRNNQLISLDLTKNVALEALNANQNLLQQLNLKNGHNAQLSMLSVLDNPNLSCIQVDDVAFANSNTNWLKDATTSYNESCYVYIPDVNFKAYLVNNYQINTNGDGEVSLSEAIAYAGTIDIYDKNVSDLTGLEAFLNISGFRSSNNPLSNVDLSANVKLTLLQLSSFQLTTLDLSANINLRKLYLYGSQLTNLDLSHNVFLTELDASSNQLANLDISKNKNLQNLYLPNNNLTELNLSGNPLLIDLELDDNQLTNLNLNENLNLKYFSVYNNKLTTIDLSKNLALEAFNFDTNQLSVLDVSANKLLRDVYCSNNALLSLNLKNGKNDKLQYVYAENNPNLICIQVDDIDLANSKTNWKKDAVASYSENCGFPVYIPDVNFKAHLVANSQINTDSDSEISYAEAGAFTGAIEISNKNISNLKGIEAFENIIKLDVENNALASLDISKNIKLETLIANQNQLIELNLKNGSNTKLTAMSVLSNPELSCIQIDDQALANTNSVSGVWKKDVTANYSENCNPPVYIPDANFKAYLVNRSDINTNGDNEISYAEARSYGGEIRLGDNVPSRINSKVSDLTGIEAFVNIIGLDAQGQDLTTINISQNKVLKNLILPNNQLTSIDVSNNTELQILVLDGNKLTSIDVSNNTQLFGISVSNNELLTSLNVKNGNNADLIYMLAINTPELTCIQVDNPTLSNSYSDWQKDATANYNENCGPFMATADARTKAISIYPNPVKDVLHFIGQEKINKVVVISIDGKKIAEKTMNGEKTLNVQMLSQGIYFIQVFTDEGVQAIKFIKN